MRPSTAVQWPGSAEYDAGAAHDEAFTADGGPRASYRALLADLSGRDLDALTVEANRRLADRGVTFGGDDPRPFRVDPVPRIIDAGEWEALAGGLRQRVRALDAFVADVYDGRRVVAAGVVPEHVVAGSSYFEQDLAGTRLPHGAWIGIAGLDVVRDADGGLRVLEDNARTPSGMSYALAAQQVVSEVLGTSSVGEDVRPRLGAALRRCLESSAPGVEGELVMLTDGPENSAFYDHRTLASLADLEMVRPQELRRTGDRVELVDGRPVRAVYRRTDTDEVRRPGGEELTDIARLLLEPVRAGGVGMVNRFGAGVADDKFVYAYVDDLVRFYLEEEPLVRSVRTYDLRDEARREEALGCLDELVAKPRDGQGGEGVVVGPSAPARELDRVRRAIVERPEDWIVQEAVTLSTHPTVVDGRLEPRHVDLRPFVFNDGTDVEVLPFGLSRVAMERGSMVVNSSRAGGAKATWVV